MSNWSWKNKRKIMNKSFCKINKNSQTKFKHRFLNKK